MKILITAATAIELKATAIKVRKSKMLLSRKKISILTSGVGLASTTYAFTKEIGLQKPDFVIQIGIAGSFDKSIPLGSVMIVEKDLFADMGVVENKVFKNIFDLGLVQSNKQPYTNGWLVNKTKLPKDITLGRVNGISVNQITTSSKMIDYYVMEQRASIESMEGAALHYVCLQDKIPFIQLRSVSNYVGERDKSKWKIKEAINNVNKELFKLLEQL